MRFRLAHPIASLRTVLGTFSVQEARSATAVGPSELTHPKYRPDIDGLRAIAVLSVVAYHAFPAWITGGFIGVDVFFVISGFLISTIILENLARGTFSFAEFYARRIKRIFPALIVVLVASYTFGWFALLSDEYKQLGKHIAAGAGFVSNFILWDEGGYFDNAAETKPLLHLWSLGIEEQFYIVWPLLLWFAWKWKFGVLGITLVVALISFGLNIERTKADALAAFYSPQTRFWELLCGGVLAWLTLHKKASSGSTASEARLWAPSSSYRGNQGGRHADVLSHCLSVAGLVLLIYGFWSIDERSAFPGLWAVVPVSGAVLLIAAGSRGCFNRTILSSKVAVWFGLISFPLYLWHWPILSFARIIESEVPDRSIRIGAVALSILLAWLTYEYVERPVRWGKGGKGKVALLSLLMILVGYVGYSTYNRDGLTFRGNARLQGHIGDIGHRHYHEYIARKYFVCTPEVIAREAPRWEGHVRCHQSKATPDVQIVLLGDSHAEHLFFGMAQNLPGRNVAYYIQNGAPFITNPEFGNIFDVILKSGTIKHVVISMMWYRGRTEVPDGSTLDGELLRVVDLLSSAGKRVHLTDDVPEFSFTPDRCKARRWLATKEPSCDMSIGEFRNQTGFFVEALRRVARDRPHVSVLDVGKHFCDEKTCSMTRGAELLYREKSHLNLVGSLYIAGRLLEDNRGLFD